MHSAVGFPAFQFFQVLLCRASISRCIRASQNQALGKFEGCDQRRAAQCRHILGGKLDDVAGAFEIIEQDGKVESQHVYISVGNLVIRVGNGQPAITAHVAVVLPEQTVDDL